jgi:hypothetical protein
MANNLLTISMITNEALMVLENELTFTSRVDRNYDDQFALVGAKIGNTVNVRRPGRFIGTTGPALNVEDFNETSSPVTLSTQFHVDTQQWRYLAAIREGLDGQGHHWHELVHGPERCVTHLRFV